MTTKIMFILKWLFTSMVGPLIVTGLILGLTVYLQTIYKDSEFLNTSSMVLFWGMIAYGIVIFCIACYNEVKDK